MSCYIKFRKRVELFSFFFIFAQFSSQIFVRNSDEKIFTSVVISHANKNYVVDKLNFKTFEFNENDKVIYNDKTLDFSVTNDTLFFFDKVKDIEEVEIVNKNNTKLKNALLSFFINQHTATYIKLNSKKRTFVKSLIFFPKFIHNTKGFLEIRILKNKNGYPDIDSPILSFQTDLSKIGDKRWEISLPKIIKYPEEGFFVDLFLESDNKEDIILKPNKETPIYFYYPQTKEWKKMSFNGYLIKLKTLQ